MMIARRLDAQYQQCHITIHQIFLKKYLLPKLNQTTRSKRGKMGFIFKVTIGIVSEAVAAFIKHR